MRLVIVALLVVFSLIVNAQTRKVLFLGNSYTQVNNLPQLTADLAASVGDTLVFDSNTPGGYTLEGHSTNPSSLTKIMEGNWDFVVLQEQSQRPSLPIEQVEIDVYPYASFLDSVITEYNSCGETMFYMTWGRKNGDASNCNWWPPVCTYTGMDSLLHLRYMIMTDTNNAVVSPVGAVWRYIRLFYPDIELYSGDESHPSVAGSYAAACSFYTAIFMKDPSLIAFNSTLDPIDAENIRLATKFVVYDNLLNWYLGENELTTDFIYTLESGFTYQFTNLSENAIGQIWDFGTVTDTASNPIHTFPTSGIYNVQLASFDNCDTIVLSKLIPVGLVGVENKGILEEIKIYPNPTHNKISLNLKVNTKISIEIYNILGENIWSNNIAWSEDIDVSSLVKGVYILEINVGNSSIVKKFIKL